MSAIADIQPRHRASDETPGEYRSLRDLLLAVSLVILAALAFQAIDRSVRTEGAPATGPAPITQDWKGNSGSLPGAR